MEELVLNFGVWYLFYLLILLILFRRYLYSIFDPAIFVLLIMASSLALSMDSDFFWYILLACLGFYLGVMTNGRIKRNTTSTVSLKNFMLLEFFTIGVFILYFIANIFLYKDTSIPLFSDNPTVEKIAIFGAGSGWIRRIFFFSSFIPIGLLLVIILSKSKTKTIIYGVMLVVFMVFSIFLGSKSGFLGFFYILWLFYTQLNLWNSENIKIRELISSKLKYIIIFSISIFVFIVYNETKENPSIFLISVAFRLMEFGDIMLYYKLDFVRNVFSNYNFIDFISNEFNGILGILRIVEYKEPLGFLMNKAYRGSVGDVITGPNTVFLVRGHIFFGYIGGIIYCYTMGWMFSFLRNRILTRDINNIFIYALLIFLFFSLEGFLREFSQYFSMIFDFAIYTLTIFAISLYLSDIFIKTKRLNNYEKNI